MYIILLENVIKVSFQNLPECDRNSRKFITTFVAGIMTIGIARYYKEFLQLDYLQDNIIHDGLCFGGIILTSKITISYWSQMDNRLKLVLFAFGFFSLLFIKKYSTKSSTDSNLKKVQ